jgi:uncharacterized integral membrane protein
MGQIYHGPHHRAPAHPRYHRGMKARTVILLVGLLLVAAIIVLNLDEFVRPIALNLAVTEVQAPLGLVLAGMLGALLVMLLLFMVFDQTAHLMEVRRLSKEVAEQRQLAERAEASRLAELREWLATAFAQLEERQQAQAEALRLHIENGRTELVRQLEDGLNGLNASLGEIEDRLERQVRLPGPPSDL